MRQTQQSDSPKTHEYSLGELLAVGDWVCAHGDRDTLAHVVQLLARRVGEPIATELRGLETSCRSDPDEVTERWERVRASIADNYE